MLRDRDLKAKRITNRYSWARHTFMKVRTGLPLMVLRMGRKEVV